MQLAQFRFKAENCRTDSLQYIPTNRARSTNFADLVQNTEVQILKAGEKVNCF